MEVELVEAPLSWNDNLEAARVQMETFLGMPFNDWLYLKNYVQVAQLVEMAKDFARVQGNGTSMTVIARVNGRVVGHALWGLPESRIHRPGPLGSTWNYLIKKKDKVERYMYPVEVPFNMERWAIFMKEHKRIADSIFGKKRNWWYLASLTVHPNFQRHGIGGKLLRWGLQRADAAGEQVYLEASPIGLGLYLKNGFIEVATCTTGGPQRGGGEVISQPCLLYG